VKSILIVDDEPGLLDLLRGILEDAGYGTQTALDGALAIALARDVVPDAVLLDYMLPVVDGAGVLHALRQEPALASIPVVMMSSLDPKLVARTCSGYEAYLRKPFRIEDMLDTVRRVIGTS
jgi:CheY-like chemotaxis protein